MEPVSVVIIFFMIALVLEIPLTLYLRTMIRRYWLDINKVWSVSLNSNNGLGSVSMVKPTKDGLKAKNGYEIATEANFAHRDRLAGNPIFVWDEDTGALLRPASGETEQSDPSVNDTKNLNNAIAKIQSAGDPFPWGMAIIALFVVIVIGFATLGVMLRGVGS